jgi:hypothetical protein
VTQNAGVATGGRPSDLISLGVLASAVPRDAVDDAIAVTGKQARRSDGKLPPHVMVYFVMALALFAEEDYEEVATLLTEALGSWGCWDGEWTVPTSGGITQARQRLGSAPLRELFAAVAVPVAEELTRGAFLAGWRLMAIDGFETSRCAAWTLDRIWERLGIGAAIRRVAAGRRLDGEAVERVVFALVAQRACEPGSKLAATGWVAQRVAIEGWPPFTDDAAYAAMDFLLDALEETAAEVFGSVAHLLNLDLDIVFGHDLHLLGDRDRRRAGRAGRGTR